ncbi:MAG TPA: hypothetical protein VEI74_02225 [Candidatus Methylomirabilis sp.]|nr:hypothetical protein [Candidatus Methylomirabilis sp.]
MKNAINHINQLKTTAYREAGHAVAHRRLRGPRRNVEILSIISYANGAGSAMPPEEWSPETENMQDNVVILCAGYAACGAAGIGDSMARQCCASDFAKAHEIIARWHLASFEEHLDEAIDLMWQPENQRAVARLADELTRHLLLLPQEIDVLIDVTDGAISEAELARLRAGGLEQNRQHRLSYLSHTYQPH